MLPQLYIIFKTLLNARSSHVQSTIAMRCRCQSHEYIPTTAGKFFQENISLDLFQIICWQYSKPCFIIRNLYYIHLLGHQILGYRCISLSQILLICSIFILVKCALHSRKARKFKTYVLHFNANWIEHINNIIVESIGETKI